MTDAPNNDQVMTRQQAFTAARESFLHAERMSLDAQRGFVVDDGPQWALAGAVNSLSYGLKILASALEDGPEG